MVVTRRQSASPIPPVASRTTSSSGSSRSSKGKGTDRSSPLKDSSPGPSYVAPNGTPSKSPPVGPRHMEDIIFDDDASPAPPKSTPTKPPVKSKSKPKAKKSSKSKKRHVNKGISGFDIIARLFLLWLTIYTLSVCPEDTQLRSPVCRALTEYRRIVLEPYIYPPIRATLDHPAVSPYLQRVQPYYNRVVQLSTPLVHRGKHHWRSRVAPRLEWLQLRARPYVLRVQRQYDSTLGPYARQVSSTALRYRSKAEPYLLAAAIRSHRSWEAVQPYLMPVWLATRRVPGIVAVYVGAPLGRARRQWVDPQVTKIWDAVVEQGKADTSAGESANTSSASFTSASSIAVSTSTTPIGDVSKTSSISTPPIPKPTDEAGASASSVVVKSVSASEPSSEPNSVSSSPVVAPHSEQTNEATDSTSSKIHDKKLSSDGEKQIPSDMDDEEEDVEELEDFLTELEVDSTPKVEEPPPPEEQEESEEGREERLRLAAIETAEKRAEIEARHTQWEKDLEDLGNAQSKVVRTTLKTLRKAASDEARAPNGPVREHVEGLVQDAEKSLKSLKAYARKLRSEDKPKNEKIKQWEKVVEKVDKKFGERVDFTAEAVRVWWDAKIEQENQEIALIARQVTNLAYKAQENLGMDYAWLADGSYYDWQRFHKLVDTSKNFADLYAGVQNGSVPNSPANPVSDIMEALQEEVDDVILGFDTNLGRVRNEGIDSFEAKKGDASPAKNIPSGEGSVPVTASGSDPAPNVSILPISPDGAKGKVEVPPVILSRGREEVESALSKAEEAKTKAAHTEL